MTQPPNDPDRPRDRPSERTDSLDPDAGDARDDPLMAAFSDRVAELEELVSRLEPVEERQRHQSARAPARQRTTGKQTTPSTTGAEADGEQEQVLRDLARLKERLEAETESDETALSELSGAIRRLRLELQPESGEGTEAEPAPEGSREDDFVYPSGERSEPEAEQPGSDSPNERNRRELERLGTLVEELRTGVGDSVRAGRSDPEATVASARRELESRHRRRQRGDDDTAPSRTAQRAEEPMSLPDVVRVLTEVIEVVKSIADEMDDTQRINGALWEILNDIQVEVVELERELSDHDRTVELDGDDLSVEEAIQRVYAHNEPFHRLADELASLQDSLELDFDDSRIEELQSELDEIEGLREEIDDLREEIARVRDDLEAVKQWQESEFLENAEIEVRGDEELREEFEALEQENRAIKELLAGLQSRVD